MSARLEQAWCSSCREWTVLDAGTPCAWCGTRLEEKRGGWKRGDRAKTSRITPAQARALHRAHENGRSINSLASQVWQTLGYASAHSCTEGIRAAFAREGLRPRSQPEATVLANANRSKRMPGESKNEYKRRARRERGYRCPRTGEWKVAA